MLQLYLLYYTMYIGNAIVLSFKQNLFKRGAPCKHLCNKTSRKQRHAHRKEKFFYDKTAPSVVRPPPKNRNNSA